MGDDEDCCAAGVVITGLLDVCPGTAASQDPARFPGGGAKTGNAPMQALGWGRRRLLEPAILVFGNANRGRTELGAARGYIILVRRLDMIFGRA